MKKNIVCIVMCLASAFCINAQSTPNADSVEIIKDYNNLYRYQNFYLSGQPSLEELQWLKSKNVTTIINLRSEGENKKYSESAYNEEIVAKDLGFEYHSITVQGSEDYTPEKLDIFLNLLKDDEKVLVHCLSAGRATYFFMAYLIKAKGYSVDEAVKVGESIKYSFPLESLLGTDITMKEM